MDNYQEMEEAPINQRVKFLSEKLSASVRAFSIALGEKLTNTSNYVNGRNKPSAEFLERLVIQFRNVSAHWLLTGEGEPFLPTPTEANSATLSTNKNFSHSQVIGSNAGSATQNLIPAPADLIALQRENELLRSQLADKERTIQILLNQHTKP